MTTHTSNPKKSQPDEDERSSRRSKSNKTANTTSDSREQSSTRLEKNWLEWLVFGISVVLVTGMVGYLLYLEFTPSSKDFDYEIGFKEAQNLNGRYLVPVNIKNKSNQSVQDVALEITSGAETADLQLDYLPRHSHRDATVFFKGKPEHVEGHINSFNLP